MPHHVLAPAICNYGSFSNLQLVYPVAPICSHSDLELQLAPPLRWPPCRSASLLWLSPPHRATIFFPPSQLAPYPAFPSPSDWLTLSFSPLLRLVPATPFLRPFPIQSRWFVWEFLGLDCCCRFCARGDMFFWAWLMQRLVLGLLDAWWWFNNCGS